MRIPRAIYEQNAGNPATPKEAAIFTGATGTSGAFNVEVSSAKKYGYLTSEAGKLVLEDRAKKAVAPQSEKDRVTALRDAVLAAPDLSAVYNFYRGENLPDDQFFFNALTDRFSIPTDKVGEFIEIFNESIRSADLLDETGERPRLIDVGRDESHRQAGAKGAALVTTIRSSSPRSSRPVSLPCAPTQRFSAPGRSWIRSGAVFERPRSS
ncbi:MAG: hypothetical protein ABJA34_13635 [Pseudonocardiales bacterium]